MNPLGIVPIGQPIIDLYDYSLKLVGLAAFVMLLVAGLSYMIPGAKKFLGEPWDIIKNVVIGVIILFSAYVILNTINPDLVRGNPTATVPTPVTNTGTSTLLPGTGTNTAITPTPTFSGGGGSGGGGGATGTF